MSLPIDVYLSEQCGSYYQLRENLERAIAGLDLKAEAIFHAVDYDDSVSLGIKCSNDVGIT